jgi:hypothetical protein
MISCEKKSSSSQQKADENAATKVEFTLDLTPANQLKLAAADPTSKETLKIVSIENLVVREDVTKAAEVNNAGSLALKGFDPKKIPLGFTSAKVEIQNPEDQTVLPFSCLMGPEIKVFMGQSFTLPCNSESKWQEYQAGTALPQTVSVTAPTEWQVYQRKNDGTGSVLLTFQNPGLPARYGRTRLVAPGLDSQWYTFALGTEKEVNFSIPAGQAGWTQVELLIYDENQQLIARHQTDRVGIGEVFIVAGGRNASNCGAKPLLSSDNVASTDGTIWQKGDDPQIGAQDMTQKDCQGGSPWPAVGSILADQKKWNVPVAFANVAYMRTTIDHWLNGKSGTDIYQALADRSAQLGEHGYRAIIWHQGEEDTPAGTSKDDYLSKLQQLIAKQRKDAKWQVPWIVATATWCQDNYYYGVGWGDSQEVRTAQTLIVEDDDVFAGPDMDTLRGDNRGQPEGNCSWSEKGAKAAADLWVPRLENFVLGATTSQ